ncbi:kynureninase [Halorubellus sp. JP-L1]|uniref:kynureninase n=1 Tax=Halorubellus sp. JP-L1 TaxID=2715753 RepID=UPI00140E796A|nr:kynureninase [Halorubellus sp. JP-L1]NHN42089.1 kynureninase [Halorubellus sp. JP-L1]
MDDTEQGDALARARERDESDPLSAFRERFEIPDDYYMDGNSLGPISADAEASLQNAVDEWRDLAIRGWTDSDPEWFHYGERLGDELAPLVGARESEVVVADSTTLNIHKLVGSFLDARGDRPPGVLVNDLDFPTDHYAIAAQLRQRGLDPDEHLHRVESPDGRTVPAEAVERALDEHDVGIVFMPSVLYRSGQLLDVERIAELAHDHGAFAGFDLAHSIGAVPHELHDLGVDFAVWCSYKYLNAGPGAIAGLYVHEDHHDVHPNLAGWWGNDKATQFDMALEFDPADAAGRFQVGTVPVLSAAPLHGALDVVHDAGIDRIREKSIQLTETLIDLADDRLAEYGVDVGTPREPARRGGHVALEHDEAYRISEALRDHGVVTDFRKPDVVRVAPAPLYTRFEDVHDVVAIIEEILETREYEEYEPQTGGVT